MISRRDFLRYCGMSAAAIGLTAGDYGRLQTLLAAPNGPVVIWLQGSGCTGCSMSFLNRISPRSPQQVADILIHKINLIYHPNIMGAAGELAVAGVQAAYEDGRYYLVVEGGVPTAFDGSACWAWTTGGQDVTFQEAAVELGQRAAGVIGVGTCACYGGIPAAPPNPTGVVPLADLIEKPVVNIPGCPPHPDWITFGIVAGLLGMPLDLDRHGRPMALFNREIHDKCPRRDREEVETWGVDHACLEELGCRGPHAMVGCNVGLWNNGTNWCVDANAPCYNCVDPQFPFAVMFAEDD
jgi:hydrogenase small subunit